MFSWLASLYSSTGAVDILNIRFCGELKTSVPESIACPAQMSGEPDGFKLAGTI